MARISQEHLDARRRQILNGAALCFARNGFHATSMQDVLKEVDLSAGAVYRYFSGKKELIGAIVAEVLETLRDTSEHAAQEGPPPLPVRAAWAKLVESYKAAGLMPEDADADAMARTMIALAQGFAAQMAVFGAASPEVLRDGLRALMSMGESTVRP